MEHEVRLKITKEFNGTDWEIHINGIKTPLKIKEKKIAAHDFYVLKNSMGTIVEAISRELEK